LNDDDEFEEYIQEENILTRISKTVKESSLWISLNEFVANAEDCGTASKVTWILDSERSTFPSKRIFCKELKAWQTPALYIYNDGIFSDSDFKALVNIGMGSKSEDTSKIGKYGLGSLTMYLFTDVPSMISGEYFIIFDPTRKHLPFERRHRRRQAGMRLRLSQMKSRFEDHLIPFVGIGGYTLGTKIWVRNFC
jgi:sacsin